MTVHEDDCASLAPGFSDFSISPSIRSNTLAVVSLAARTDVGVVPRTRLDPRALELLRELLALGLGHLPAGQWATYRCACKSLFCPTSTHGMVAVPV